MKVFHLFIDDTFVFYDAYGVHLEHLSCGFMWFKAMFGLRINMEKSELIPIGDVTNVEDLASVLGCKIGNLSSTYLSLTLGAPHKFVRVWESIEEKFQIVKGASRLRVVRRHPLAPCLKAGDAPSRRCSPLASHNVVHRMLELVDLEKGVFSIFCHFKNCEDGFIWTFTGVYGLALRRDRECFWAPKSTTGREFEFRHEKVLKSDRRLRVKGLAAAWGSFYLEWRVCPPRDLCLTISPILLDGGGLRRDPSPFRFENMWLKLEGFKDLLKSWWEGDNFSGSSSFILAEKLKSFGDAKQKTSRLSLEELEARKEAREEYKKWMANAHKRRNNVDKIRINGVWLSEENEIKEGIVNAFRSLLFNPGDWRPPLSGLQCETLENMDACALEVSFTEEGVFGALLGCNGDKAPGPDGFSMAFWQFAWDFVKDDVMSFFRDFYEYDLRDFRPISLLGSLYKWLAKVLANRLKKVVGKVVSKAQGAFVKGKQILDAVLIANEAINSVLKNNENGILCKLDIEKAYDNVDWVKGRSEKGVQISHLLFADDALVFCQASQDHLTYLSWLLMWFEAVSGLRINLEKSELISVGRVENIDDLALDFGCRVGSLPSTYLGLPLGALFKSVTVWDGVEERFHRSSVRRRLEQIQRDFLWGGGSERGAWRGGLWKGIRMDWDLVGARILFLVAFNDWEAERFLERLHGKRVLGDVEDMVFWTEIKSGKFSVKSLYLALEAGCPCLFSSSCIWNVKEDGPWQVDVLCVLRKKRPQTVFFCIVKKQGSYEIYSLLCLGCHGCCLLQLERLSLADMVLLWAKSARRCGELLLFTFFGRFGRREIEWLSRMMCCQSKDLNTDSCPIGVSADSCPAGAP
ncbi:Transposon TX1 uncharacterized 149 kDa protein [Vitis vinifera]|uniref:Transposon TX1 uncharacterized 149 kDa protein n=1 Tax=Vitis vinifera TaxID=29760 RepID=A0A438JNC3_VITVI|nr:Transposon TX1 uncharacterized 149 kDa protein [Vitis vinifera]